ITAWIESLLTHRNHEDVSFLTLSEQKAKSDGFATLRWAGDITWLKQDNISTADFFLFEAKLNNLFHEIDITAVLSGCQGRRK
ncbi:MAG: hypothetical protein ACXWRE_17185, partial [Pseudobdellovibrionaceae bacterium]